MALMWEMMCNLGDPMSLRHPVTSSYGKCDVCMYLYMYKQKHVHTQRYTHTYITTIWHAISNATECFLLWVLRCMRTFTFMHTRTPTYTHTHTCTHTHTLRPLAQSMCVLLFWLGPCWGLLELFPRVDYLENVLYWSHFVAQQTRKHTNTHTLSLSQTHTHTHTHRHTQAHTYTHTHTHIHTHTHTRTHTHTHV